jgi:small-conductance mechanosensitive channel
MPQDFTAMTHAVVSIAWICAAVAIAYAVGTAVSWVVQRIGRRSALITDVAHFTRMSFRTLLMVIAAGIAVKRVIDPSASWRGWVDHTVVIAGIAASTWVVASLVNVVERQAIHRFGGGDTGLTDADRHRRRFVTQVTVLRRLTIAVVVAFGLAAALMTYPSFTDIGKTLFASAGVLSVVAGLAAQTSLGAVFAGIQIAFSGAIRVGDVVVLEDEWGRIEEITLTYVVVHVWDERRLVLPCTYFTTKPFQNWTRNATELLGTAEFDLDFTVPIDAMRAELERMLAGDDLWDGRVGIVQVTDCVGGYLRIRVLVSASNAPALFDLRCHVREGITGWLQRTNPGALPRWRVERFEGQAPELETRDLTNRRDLADASLFSGSEEAEQRGRAFETVDGLEPEPALAGHTNGHAAPRDQLGPSS